MEQQRCVVIGFQREDGDFQAQAYLDNLDELLTSEQFEAVIAITKNALEERLEMPLVVIDRQEMDSIIDISDDVEAQMQIAAQSEM